MRRFIALLLLCASFASAACVTDPRGIVTTGLPALQDWLLGPLTCLGTNPWIYGDLALEGVVQSMAPAALLETPTLGAALTGTVSFTSGDHIFFTTNDQSGVVSPGQVIIVAWNSSDGAGTGRMICPIDFVNASIISCAQFFRQPSFSGVTAYRPGAAGPSGCTFTSQCGWTVESPSVSWPYYDTGTGINRLHYRIGSSDTTYLGYARSYADIVWQWTLDHGYHTVYPRASSLIGQFFRAVELGGSAMSNRLAGIYTYLSILQPNWGDPSGVPYIDNREFSYWTWGVAMGARVDTDLTRHNQYCSWLVPNVTAWIARQDADGSWGEDEIAINSGYISAPKQYTGTITFGGSPWREAINLKALEAAYDALLDTSSTTGCNQPALAASTLTAITNGVTWQRNYGRNSVDRGIYYTLNSQSNEQESVGGAGTVSINNGSTTLTGSGTNWQTAHLITHAGVDTGPMCDGTHYVGFIAPRTVYRIVSCTSNTAAVINANYGSLGEMGNLSGSTIGYAPTASNTCNSSATWCISSGGDPNLPRTVCGDTGWLYAHTLNPIHLAWADECAAFALGGPTAGLNINANVGFVSLPCSGPACSGYVNDMVTSAATCGVVPCIFFGSVLSNQGKNFGEAWGAPGIDNELAWRLFGIQLGGSAKHGKHILPGKEILH